MKNEKRYLKSKAKEIYEIFESMCTNFWCEKDIINILQKVLEKGKEYNKEKIK